MLGKMCARVLIECLCSFDLFLKAKLPGGNGIGRIMYSKHVVFPAYVHRVPNVVENVECPEGARVANREPMCVP